MDFKELLIEHSAGNLYWKDKNGIYLGCNENFARLLRLKSSSEIVGKTEYDLFEDVKKAKTIIETDNKVITSGKEITVEEMGLDINGNPAIYFSHKAPFRDKKGEVIGLVGTSIDITKQKAAEKIKAEFIANMSHDLRTPFSGILCLSEMLLSTEKDKSRIELHKDVVSSAKCLLKLLNQVIEITSVEIDPINTSSFKLKQLIDDIIELYRASLSAKKLIIQVFCPDIELKTDKFRVEKILINLVSNAIKYTNVGSITVKVTIGDNIEIVVEDTGIGIPKDKFEFIFDQFTRLQPSYTEKTFTGSGIGLYIAKKYANDLGGGIFVDSQEGLGSKFTFYLNQTVLKNNF